MFSSTFLCHSMSLHPVIYWKRFLSHLDLGWAFPVFHEAFTLFLWFIQVQLTALDLMLSDFHFLLQTIHLSLHFFTFFSISFASLGKQIVEFKTLFSGVLLTLVLLSHANIKVVFSHFPFFSFGWIHAFFTIFTFGTCSLNSSISFNLTYHMFFPFWNLR